MTKNKKKAKKNTISKQKSSAGKIESNGETKQKEIISKITEETIILQGIIARFSKPVSDDT